MQKEQEALRMTQKEVDDLINQEQEFQATMKAPIAPIT